MNLSPLINLFITGRHLEALTFQYFKYGAMNILIFVF